MGRFPLTLSLGPPPPGRPLFVHIADALVAEMQRGRLTAGTRLPGARQLARELGVHRNTVVAAYQELQSQGFVRSKPARGTFVTGNPFDPRSAASLRRAPRRLPERTAFPLADPDAPVFGMPLFQMRAELSPVGGYLLTGGRPDPRLFPTELLARAQRRVLRRAGRMLLDYGDPQGHHALRAALAAMLNDVRGLCASPEDILITRGSQMALMLVWRALLSRGSRLAVEAYGYPPAWAAAVACGAVLAPLPVDDEGVQVQALVALSRRKRITACYVTPHHQYPTTVTLTPGRRALLLRCAQRAGMAVVEDDYDHEYHYAGRPVLPLASLDHGGTVIYVGSLSKVLAPGLRLGYVVAPRPFVAQLTRLRMLYDRQGDLPGEAALAELIEEGEIQRHIRRTRRIYLARRDAFVASLTRHLGGALEIRVPDGGIAMWTKADPTIDVERWRARAAKAGVYVTTGSACRIDGCQVPYLRLGFCRHTPEEQERAVALLAEALP